MKYSLGISNFLEEISSLSHCVIFLYFFALIANSLPPQVQAPLSMEFSREEYWSRLPFPPPGHLPNPGTEPVSPAPSALAGEFFTAESLERPRSKCTYSEMGFVN